MDRPRPQDKPLNVENVVVTCMDFRFQEVIKLILKNRHSVDIDHVDRLAIGGASKKVEDGTLMPSLQIAYDKHNARNLFLFDHIDCGGFGGLAAFGNDEQREAEAHFKHLDGATEAINKLLPEFVVVTYLVGMDGEPVER